jgi:hypothetical protein
MTSVLLRREEGAHKHRGIVTEGRQRQTGSDVATSQGTPGATRS